MYFFYYIPVGMDTEVRRPPSMTIFFSILCSVIFFSNKYLSESMPLNFMNLVYVPGQSGLLTAMTSAFLHLGHMHLIGNLIYLAFVGRYVEDRLGPVLFAVLFISSAWIGNVLQGVYNAHVLHRQVAGIIGASGAVSALLGVFAVRFCAAKLKVAYWVFMPLQAYTKAGTVDVPAVLAVGLWFVIQAARGLVQYGGGWENVAYVTHIAGFAWGFAVALAAGEFGKGRMEALWKKSRKMMERADYFGAQEALLKYIEKTPADGLAYASLARAQLLAGEKARARANYQRACETHLAGRQRGEAENAYREALRAFADFTLGPAQQIDLAFGLERSLKPDLALAAYGNFERCYPGHPEAPFSLLRTANLHWSTYSDAAQAARCYERLIDRYPEDSWVDFAREQVRVLDPLRSS
ncbi:MAG: rhomboid family intramembrane serine protease [Chitinivibrionia bacterium]|nr:rhomboid family intramembrane serine protease [Chitinivibrionia bacterium]